MILKFNYIFNFLLLDISYLPFVGVIQFINSIFSLKKVFGN
jgi:hypothetical protein